MKLQKKRLLAVKERILEKPERFEMDHWFGPSKCGTSCCIGGYALANLGYRHRAIPVNDGMGGVDIRRYLVSPKGKNLGDIYKSEQEARKQLGLTHVQAKVLFFEENWPEPFKSDFWKAKDYQSKEMAAKVAAARIDHFIAANGKE
jgi:hypothetical protein